MIYIKRFIDKVTATEGRQSKDVVIPITEARGLRDELAKLLLESYQKNSERKPEIEPVIQVEMRGGSFK